MSSIRSYCPVSSHIASEKRESSHRRRKFMAKPACRCFPYCWESLPRFRRTHTTSANRTGDQVFISSSCRNDDQRVMIMIQISNCNQPDLNNGGAAGVRGL
eukprot:92169-Pleurochrysis_carterae.AAC.3